MIDSTPRFLQGAFAFTGAGLTTARLAGPVAGLRRSGGQARAADLPARRQLHGELAYVTLMQDGKPARMFPLGAKAGIHVPLAVVEDLQPDTRIEVFSAPPRACRGTIVLDVGIIEI